MQGSSMRCPSVNAGPGRWPFLQICYAVSYRVTGTKVGRARGVAFDILPSVITLFYLLVLEQILQGFYSLWQGLEWLKMARKHAAAGSGFYTPRVALVCPVKGMEEDLESNLLSLTQFDYPQYEIFFAIATADDPAYRVLERVVAASKRPAHIVRAGRTLDCSDKVHNLTAAVAEIGEQFEVLVFTDSDGRPPRTW